MIDLETPDNKKHGGKLRREWGLQNTVGLEHMSRAMMKNNEHRQRMVKGKIETFMQQAVYPQQLTIPRSYATTREGTFIPKGGILKNREIDRVAGGGVRVVVQENAQQSRFMISPLFGSEQDALKWAVKHTGVTL